MWPSVKRRSQGAGRLRRGDGEAAELHLGRVATGHGQVVETPGAERDRLGDARDELALGQATSAPFERHRGIDRFSDSDRSRGVTEQLGAAVGGDRAIGGLDAYSHLGSGLLCQERGLRTTAFFLARRPFSRTRASPSARYRGI